MTLRLGFTRPWLEAGVQSPESGGTPSGGGPASVEATQLAEPWPWLEAEGPWPWPWLEAEVLADSCGFGGCTEPPDPAQLEAEAWPLPWLESVELALPWLEAVELSLSWLEAVAGSIRERSKIQETYVNTSGSL